MKEQYILILICSNRYLILKLKNYNFKDVCYTFNCGETNIRQKIVGTNMNGVN